MEIAGRKAFKKSGLEGVAKMGIFSKVNRYREAGQQANVQNTQRFGEPSYSLFTTSKVLTLHHHIDITDSNENIVYYADTKFPSLHDKTDIFNAKGNHIAHIEKKILTLHERHFITMEKGVEFKLSNEILHIIKDVTNIEGLGWKLQGNILGLNFELYDKDQRIIAVIGQKMISVHDKYCIDIYQKAYEEEIVAILITLQHMIRDRENNSAASASAGD